MREVTEKTKELKTTETRRGRTVQLLHSESMGRTGGRADRTRSAEHGGRRQTEQQTKGARAGAGGSVRVIPLGGLDQIGMNITAIETEESLIIVDCGLSFPSDDMLGIDLVIPDISYLKSKMEKIKGFVITHGHEDHIGALPYVLQQINVPVYATKLTLALIERKLVERGMDQLVKTKTMKFGQTVNFGDLKVEFVKTNHSIQDAAALAIYTPAGVLVHTGDFKVDYTPVFGDQIDLQRFAELGKNGVLGLRYFSS